MPFLLYSWWIGWERILLKISTLRTYRSGPFSARLASWSNSLHGSDDETLWGGRNKSWWAQTLNPVLLLSKCTSSYGWHEQMCFSALESGRARCEANLCLRPIDVHSHRQEAFGKSGLGVEVILCSWLFLQAGSQVCNSCSLAIFSAKFFCGNVIYSVTKIQLVFIWGVQGPWTSVREGEQVESSCGHSCSYNSGIILNPLRCCTVLVG